MKATSNEILGSLIYRTTQALNRNTQFIKGLEKYIFWPNLVNEGRFHLWHFPGTGQEISGVFQVLGENPIFGAKLKFPAILNFQSIVEEHGFMEGVTARRYNLAIISPVLSEWTTQEREAQVYKQVLRPIEDELINQIERCEYLQTPLGSFPYVSAYVPTTGNALNSVMKNRYGDFVDVIELPAFTLKTKNDICDAMSNKIIEESNKVTDEIKNIIK